MRYHLIYDAQHYHDSLIFVYILIANVIVCAIIGYFYFGGVSNYRFKYKSLSFIIIILMSIMINIGSFMRYIVYSKPIDTNQCAEVEGNISQFSPAPEDSKPAYESFTLRDIRFAYGPGLVTGGYNQAGGANGLLRVGVPVRLCFTSYGTQPQDRIILHLEVANS